MALAGGSPKIIDPTAGLSRRQLAAYFKRQQARLDQLIAEVEAVSDLASAKTALTHITVALQALLDQDRGLAARIIR